MNRWEIVMKEPKESDILRVCLQYLGAKGILAWRSNNTGVYDPARKMFRTFHGLKGVSDIVGLLPGGRFLGVETKTETGKLSEDQKLFIDMVNNNGGLAFVVRSVGQLAAVIEAVLRDDGGEICVPTR